MNKPIVIVQQNGKKWEVWIDYRGEPHSPHQFQDFDNEDLAKTYADDLTISTGYETFYLDSP